MGLLNIILRLFGIRGAQPADVQPTRSLNHGGKDAPRPSGSSIKPADFISTLSTPAPSTVANKLPVPDQSAPANLQPSTNSGSHSAKKTKAPKGRAVRPRKVFRLGRLNYRSNLVPTPAHLEVVNYLPYQFAQHASRTEYFDFSQDSDARWLEHFNLPLLKTPADLANWLEVPIGQLAWLTHLTDENLRPRSTKQTHYHYQFVKKRSGEFRLIESPKSKLKEVQGKILCGILDHVAPHNAAHGFVSGRSIITNAEPHVRQKLVIHMDLKNFYPNVRVSRVVAIFRSIGYSREVALWLARLTTNSVPWDLKFPAGQFGYDYYHSRHLPQGAPTSPSLANLSAFSLDVRLTGLANSYQMEYTRYADDLTFSGAGVLYPALPEIIPMIKEIIRHERFYPNHVKQKVLRPCFRQKITGIVVNEKLNIDRREFDRLKAILHNCRRLGPSTQKRNVQTDFRSHLQGRIAHVRQINAHRAMKLQHIYDQINWSK